VDAEKQARIAEIAERYLAGERLPDLAAEFGMNRGNIGRVLAARCGTRWQVTIRSGRLNIEETIVFEVPRLLPDKTIRAVRRRLQDNKTRLHGRPTHDYLLNGYVFCAACGYHMTGQPVSPDLRYYRHACHYKGRDCPLCPRRPRVRAERIEQGVLRDLFNLFGNPAAIERACQAAAPDCAKARKQKARLEAELEKVAKARGRLIDAIADGVLSKAEAQRKMDDLREQEAGLAAELDRVSAALDAVPDLDALRLTAERQEGAIIVYDQHGNAQREDGSFYLGGTDLGTWLYSPRQDWRELVQAVFSAPLVDGKPSGVYVTQTGGSPHGPKSFTYEMRGHLSWRVVQGTLSSPSG
jgi:hypothetical protein